VDGLVPSSNLSSQRISDLLSDINESDRFKFYKEWSSYRQEIEYLAFDVTSISSYSNQISDVTWVYNRDKEKLRQINLCLLFGEDSGLPIYSTSYSGSVTDVSAFCTIINQINFINPDKIYKIVLDKGFYSRKNINKLIYNNKSKFIISVPIKDRNILNLIDEYRSIFNQNYLFHINKDIYYATTINYKWDCDTNLFLHIYYNELINSLEKHDVNLDMVMLKNEAEKNPLNYKNTYDHKKYLIYTPTNDDNLSFDISLKLESIEKLYKNKGWFFILSNEVSDFQVAHKVYRQKDTVEKAFCRLKHNLDLKRLRTHTDKTTENKLFIAFISLILISYINKIMQNSNLNELYTIKSMLDKLDNIKFININDKILLKQIIKSEKNIFQAFNILIE
jgi:transposase